MHNDFDNGTVDFVHAIHEMFLQQKDALIRRDHAAARHIGNRIKRLLPSLIRIIKVSRELSNSHAIEIMTLAHQIRDMHRESTENMIMEKDRLARELYNIRKGRRMLVNYRTDSSVKQIFEMQG